MHLHGCLVKKATSLGQNSCAVDLLSTDIRLDRLFSTIGSHRICCHVSILLFARLLRTGPERCKKLIGRNIGDEFHALLESLLRESLADSSED